jgi:hypothetical protein
MNRIMNTVSSIATLAVVAAIAVGSYRVVEIERERTELLNQRAEQIVYLQNKLVDASGALQKASATLKQESGRACLPSFRAQTASVEMPEEPARLVIVKDEASDSFHPLKDAKRFLTNHF